MKNVENKRKRRMWLGVTGDYSCRLNVEKPSPGRWFFSWDLSEIRSQSHKAGERTLPNQSNSWFRGFGVGTSLSCWNHQRKASVIGKQWAQRRVVHDRVWQGPILGRNAGFYSCVVRNHWAFYPGEWPDVVSISQRSKESHQEAVAGF